MRVRTGLENHERSPLRLVIDKAPLVPMPVFINAQPAGARAQIP